MPPQYHDTDARQAYKNYVNGEKAYFARWAYTPTPSWFIPLPIEKTVLSAPEIRSELKSRGLGHDAKKEDNLRTLKAAVTPSDKVLFSRIAVTEQAFAAQRTPAAKKKSSSRVATLKKKSPIKTKRSKASSAPSSRTAKAKKNPALGQSSVASANVAQSSAMALPRRSTRIRKPRAIF